MFCESSEWRCGVSAVRPLCLPFRPLCLPFRPLCLPFRPLRPPIRPPIRLPIRPPIRPLRPFWPFRLSVCLVRLSARPPVRPFALSPSVPSVPSALSLRLSALSDPCLSFYPFCPPICPPIRLVPSASSLRLSALSDSRLFLYPLRSSRPPALTFLSAPPAHLPVRASSLRSFVSVRSVRSVRSACPVRLLRPSRSGAAEFYSADFAQCFVFSSQDVFSHPISDTLLKSRRGELGISDNN